MKIIFMRHGETDWNVAGKIQGIRPVPINLTGIRQIKETCEYFRISSEFRFSHLISSPLLRAKQSAKICSQMLHVPAHVLTDFRERSFGIFEGKTNYEIKDHYGIPDIEKVDQALNGIEPILMLEKRLTNGLKILKTNYKDKNILVMTHGSVIRQIGRWQNLELGIIPNGAFVQLDI